MYVIDEYNVPGPTAHSVRLVWRGLPPRLGAGVSLALLLALAGLAMATIVAESGDGVHPAVLIGAAVGVGFLGYLAVRGDRQAYVSALTWEARRGALFITRGGAFPGFGREAQVPFDRVRSLTLDVGGESGLLWIRCRVEQADGPGLDEWLQIRGVDRQSKALDLAVRIGAAMGWKGYRVTKGTPQSIRIALTTDAATGPLAGGIPARDDDPSYGEGPSPPLDEGE